MPTDIKTQQLIINTLTKSQYESCEKVDTELYMVTDEIPLSSGDNISLLNNDRGYATEQYVNDIVGDIETILNNINSGG